MDKKWNLQDIRPAGDRPKRIQTKQQQEVPETEYREKVSSSKISRKPDGKKRKSFIIGLIAICLILVPGFVIGFLLDGTSITTYPRTRELDVNTTLKAFSDPSANELSYEIMTLEAEGERQVQATGEEEVQEQAQGEIEISNTRSTSERLVKNTRFESPEGYIFKITESAVIPAATTDDEGSVIPGTVRARVFADEPGEEYNIGPSDFTIPGYAEGGFTEHFEAVTARSSTPMQGGFDGLKYIVDDEELAAAKESLHEELREALYDRVNEERPAGFIFFEPSVTYSFESMPSSEASDDMVTIKEKARLHAPLFEENEFAKYLASSVLPGYEQEPVRIDDPSALTFSYVATSTQETDLRGLDSIDFNLSGNPLIVWTFDETSLKTDLVDAAKNSLPSILGGYPAIERAEAVIRPFWKRSFPSDPEEIEIIISTTERE